MNCVKCGRPIPDGEIFCENCSSTPLHPEPRAEKSAGKHLAPKKQAARQRKWPTTSIVALVIMALIASACAGFMFQMYRSTAQQRTDLRVREAALADRESAAAALESELASAQQTLTAAQSTITELREKIASLEEEVHGSQSSLSQSQYDMDATLRELEELRGEKEQLEAEAETMLEEKSLLEEQLEALRGDLSTVRAEKDALSEKLAWIDAYVVYVENDGTNYYHNYDCENFKKSSFWVYNRKLAENKGYTACPICGG